MAGNGEQKFISIYKAYVDEIYQYIFLRTGYDVSLAEDLTQDIFLEVYKGIMDSEDFVRKEHGYLR